MSKRYGRNQKRAHRERIAELEGQVRVLATRVEYSSGERLKLERALAAQRHEVRRIVDEIEAVSLHSAIIPAKELGLTHPNEGPWRLRVLGERLHVCTIATNASLEAPMMISTVDIHEVSACLDRNLAAFQRIVHVKLPGSAVRYAISREAMRAFSRHGLGRIEEDLVLAIRDAWSAI